jgi:hypothetical protein
MAPLMINEKEIFDKKSSALLNMKIRTPLIRKAKIVRNHLLNSLSPCKSPQLIPGLQTNDISIGPDKE